MRWEIKAVVQGVLSRAPGGYELHRRLQRINGSDRLDVDLEYKRKARFLHRLLEQGIPLEGATILEIGTGWHPFLPLVLQLMGARRTVTLDVNPWLTSETLDETLQATESQLERLSAEFGVREDAARARLAALRDRIRTGATLAQVLKEADVEYCCPMDAGDSGLPAQSFDLVMSSNVFEHIPPSELRRIVAESRRLLRPGGVSAHHIDTADHFATDERITSVNFLKYSPRAWRLISRGLAYHNRLRCREYPRLFEEAGFSLLDVMLETDERALAALRDGAVRPNEAFRAFTHQELAEVLVDVFARVPAERAVTPQELSPGSSQSSR